MATGLQTISTQEPTIPTNWLYFFMEEISKSITGGQNQQFADSEMTIANTKIENNLYNTWLTQLNADSAQVENYAAQLAKNPNDKTLQNELAGAQQKYQNDKTQESVQTSQADSMTQTMQTQAGQDSSFMQLKMQLEQAITTICQTISSALANS